MPFRDQTSLDKRAIPTSLSDYVQLVDWSGRAVRRDKRGAIDEHAPILERLNIDPDVWQQAMRIRGNVFGRAPGKLDRLRLHAHALGQSRIKGLICAERLFRPV